MYQKLPKAVEKLVKGFFCDDEFSRQLPGKKYFYQYPTNCAYAKASELKKTISRNKDCSSKFFVLRPKHCILVGSSGTHTVCILYTEM